jgi:isoamylase
VAGPDGHEMTTEEWEKDFARCLGMWLNGEELPETDERGRPLHDATFLVLFNAHDDVVRFKLPPLLDGSAWRTEIDTTGPEGEPAADAPAPIGIYPIQGRSLVVLRQVVPEGTQA